MALSIEEIREQLKSSKKRATINRAKAHQDRIKFHAQTRMEADLGQPVVDFLAWVGNIIPADKFKIFKSMFRYPIFTNEVTGIVFDRLSRIFDGRNPAFNYQFLTSEMRDDWEDYRLNVLGEPSVWQTKGWEQFQTEINSVLVVDVPTEQSAGLPQPYFYWLSIDKVLAYEAHPMTGEMAWIIFRQPEKRIAVIDDQRYMVFAEGKDGNIGDLLIDSPHDLGYCPARFFWTEPLRIDEPDVKRSPISKELEALDWLLFFHISKRHLDLYGAYPIYSGYAQACDYENESGSYCEGGYLKDKQGHYMHDAAGLPMCCPKCGSKRIAGAGSFVEIPVPNDNQPDLRNPVQMLSVDTASLDYNVSEEERLIENIITAIVGADSELINDQAVNDKQVSASYESQTTVLHRVKKGFEQAQKFVDETICRLRYGSGFVSATINYGTEFYMLSPTELRERYALARDNGASEAELDALHNQIIETEYRHDPTQLQRMLLLAELEPYRHLSRSEVLNLYDKQIISAEDMKIKLNFANFVRRFERENLNVLKFRTDYPFARRVELIAEEFRKYANENINQQQQQ